MSLLRTTLTLLPKRCFLDPTFLPILARNFHTPAPLHSKAPPRKSPRVRASQNPSSTTIRRKKEANLVYDVEASLPSLSLLKTASKDGKLEVEPERALEFLREFSMKVNEERPDKWEKTLCAEHNITPLTLFHLSTTLLSPTSSPTAAQTVLAKALMTSSYTQGCKEATYTIMHAALQSKKPIKPQSEVLLHLKSLAANGDEPQAMTLLGLVLRSQGKDKESLGWFLKAVNWDAETPLQEKLNLNFSGANEALFSIGKVFLDLSHAHPHNLPAAKEAFRIAALHLDSPHAYFELSRLVKDGEKKRGYLLKAAASGVAEAYAELAKSAGAGSNGEENLNVGGSMDHEWAMLAKQYALLEGAQGKTVP